MIISILYLFSRILNIQTLRGPLIIGSGKYKWKWKSVEKTIVHRKGDVRQYEKHNSIMTKGATHG